MTVMVPNIEKDDTGEDVVTWRVRLRIISLIDNMHSQPQVPLGEGAVPHVALCDCGVYVRWLLDNQEKANGMDLQVAIAHIGYDELAAGFAKVTGRKARYVDVSLDEFWRTGPIARAGKLAAGSATTLLVLSAR